ncbi:putative gliotoxin biosynthesis protein [Phaeomoniella chlamydospora]|uniref:gamma-glutamylcyclotransferase n=1 Tax=Phaeomoniella chlamydospora TaxID=158046 RepID=A0A0G2DVL1_PHACM|nr:putative gliotoxin biosynthesis protein [Phaeomoniella chlamydospora]
MDDPRGSRIRRAAHELNVVHQSLRHSNLTSHLALTPATSFERLEKSRIGSPETAGSQETFLYLAYGSNLCAATFRGARGIKPLSEVNVVVPSLSLTFDLSGTPYNEPCFANTAKRTISSNGIHDNETSEKTPLLASSKSSLHWDKGLVGVVYEVTSSDYAHIIATEGGGASYDDILVDCYELAADPTIPVPTVPTSKSFKAHTLFAPIDNNDSMRREPNYAQPSPRYLNLITSGADEHSFPNEYRAYLNSLQPYIITSKRQELGRYIFLMTWGPILGLLFGLANSGKGEDDEGKWPEWMVKLLHTLFTGIWWSYDHVMKQRFGDGERTEEDRGDKSGKGRSETDTKKSKSSSKYDQENEKIGWDMV